MNETIENAILATLTADRYSLGAHWIYDEKELQKLEINWEELNAPKSLWHKGKKRGDLTHYGEHLLFLIDFLKKNAAFEREAYYAFWREKMGDYSGYVDASSRSALESIGAISQDLSICGRMAPLLLCSQNKETFLKNVTAFVSVTHNSELAQQASAFFAQFLWESQTSQNRASIIDMLAQKHPQFQAWINAAKAKKNAPSFEAIREFGPACGIDGGFTSVIYLLLQEKSFKELMIENAKAGGDSAARAMVVAMILGISNKADIPQEWLA